MKLSILQRLLKISVVLGFALAGFGVNSDMNAFLLTAVYPRWVAFDVAALGEESVREDLIELQKQTGLTLVTMESGETLAVDFERRKLSKIGDARGTGAISHDGTEVAFSYFSGVLPTHLGISKQCPVVVTRQSIRRLCGNSQYVRGRSGARCRKLPAQSQATL